MLVCVCVCEREREREVSFTCVCASVRACICMRTCVCMRECMRWQGGVRQQVCLQTDVCDRLSEDRQVGRLGWREGEGGEGGIDPCWPGLRFGSTSHQLHGRAVKASALSARGRGFQSRKRHTIDLKMEESWVFLIFFL